MKTVILLAILFLYSSCGYEVPGKDKHPEIPEFNGFDKNLFIVDTLLTEEDVMSSDRIIYDPTDDFIYLNKEYDWFLLDKNFKIKQKINAKGVFQGNKTFYDKVIGEKYKDIIYKYTYPWTKAEKVKELQYLGHDSIIKNYSIPKDKNGKYDLEAIRKIGRQYIDEQLGVIQKNNSCRFHVYCVHRKQRRIFYGRL